MPFERRVARIGRCRMTESMFRDCCLSARWEQHASDCLKVGAVAEPWEGSEEMAFADAEPGAPLGRVGGQIEFEIPESDLARAIGRSLEELQHVTQVTLQQQVVRVSGGTVIIRTTVQHIPDRQKGDR